MYTLTRSVRGRYELHSFGGLVMYKTYGYAAKDAGSPPGPFEFERRAARV